MALGDIYKEGMRFVQARTAPVLRKHVSGGAKLPVASGTARGCISPSHGENRGSSPLGSATTKFAL
jgi:hypothetical protein